MKRTLSDVISVLAYRITHAGSQQVTREELDDLAELAAYLGGIDEIDRIQTNMLDADIDVWSEDDDGQIISIAQRRAELQREVDKRTER